MQWKRSFHNSEGELRRQFAQWKVPEHFLMKTGLKDGDECRILMRSGNLSYKGVLKLSSGGELRLPGDTAKRLAQQAQQEPHGEVTFTLDRESLHITQAKSLGIRNPNW